MHSTYLDGENELVSDLVKLLKRAHSSFAVENRWDKSVLASKSDANVVLEDELDQEAYDTEMATRAAAQQARLQHWTQAMCGQEINVFLEDPSGNRVGLNVKDSMT